ncbi:MAG: AsmA family protein [Rhodomicrobium sp.]|nr:AsmA family protein [Rhodomicrobium sp.]
MKRLLAVLASVLAALVIAALLLPYLIPQSYVQRQLARLLAQETGLYLQDAQRLRLTLFPRLGIAVEGVSVAFPESLGHGPLMRAGRIFAAIEPLSMFERRIRVSSLKIESPSLFFHVDASGRPNWNTTALRRQPRFAMTALAALGDSPLTLKTSAQLAAVPERTRALPAIDIDIVNGAVAYQDDVRRRRLEIGAINLVLRSGGAEGPVALEGELKVQGMPLKLAAKASPHRGDAERSALLQVALRSDIFESHLDGQLSWGAHPHFSGHGRMSMASGAKLGDWIGASPKALSRFDGARLSGRLDLSGDQLALTDGEIAAPGAQGRLTLTADPAGSVKAIVEQMRLHGGEASGKFSLDMGKPDAALTLSFQMSGVDNLALTKGASGFDWLSGRADAAIDLSGRGRMPEDIAQSLSGSARLSVADGAIEGLDLPLIVAEAKEAKFKSWRREAGRRTPFDRLTATFQIADGVAKTQDLKLSGPNIAADGEGKTDLAQGVIEYRLKTRVAALAQPAQPDGVAKDGSALPAEAETSLALPLLVKGDWDKPGIYPDVENALKDTDSLLGTAKLFGKSVEKFTDGTIKADDFGRALDRLFGKKKKHESETE